MKKQMLILMALLISVTMHGQVSKTITDLTPGELINKITPTELTKITNLTLSGTIDARDFFKIRQKMTSLSVIDLTNITIAEYTGKEAIESGSLLTFPANTIPLGAFHTMASLTSVTFPENITSIGSSVFLNDINLSSVNIPNTVKIIEDRAFYGCKSLSSITIPASVDSIGIYAFTQSNIQVTVNAVNLHYSSTEGVLFNKDQTTLIYYPPSKTGDYSIPSSVKTLADVAFLACTGLTSVNMPNSVTTMGGGVFSGCTGLTSVILSDSITRIELYTFTDCKSLTSVTLPNSITSIGNGTFARCTALTSITLPDRLTSIGDRVFEECTGLTSIIVPNSITTIGMNAFFNCNGLTSIILPERLTTIGDGAFTKCTGLTSIIIPNSVTTIGITAFVQCTGLIAVTLPDQLTNIAVGAFNECTGLTSVTIPNSVTTIGMNAFARCSSLKSVALPDQLTTIGMNAFSGCSSLTSIYTKQTVPIHLSYTNIFEGVNKNTCTLYVPASSVDLYKAATIWKSFINVKDILTSSEPEIQNRKVLIWPNPSKNAITINSEKGLANIYNANGQLVTSQSLENNRVVNISFLNSGNYIVVVNGESFKLIKE